MMSGEFAAVDGLTKELHIVGVSHVTLPVQQASCRAARYRAVSCHLRPTWFLLTQALRGPCFLLSVYSVLAVIWLLFASMAAGTARMSAAQEPGGPLFKLGPPNTETFEQAHPRPRLPLGCGLVRANAATPTLWVIRALFVNFETSSIQDIVPSCQSF